MKPNLIIIVTTMIGALVLSTPAVAADWEQGSWSIVVSTSGTPGTANCDISYPGGTNSGNVLAVHYNVSSGHYPQLYAFLTDGFIRLVSDETTFGTSYRLFRYHSSAGQDCDVSSVKEINVHGVTTDGELYISLVYTNYADCGDRFTITADAYLEIPTTNQTGMRVSMTVSNTTGSSVAALENHRDLAEQWELFGISSMYVTTNLTGGLPSWYDSLDPSHQYVGITNDAAYTNDGYSVNGNIYVSTHDINMVTGKNFSVTLAHDTNACPVVTVHGYTSYSELVLIDQPSSFLKMQHAYEQGKNHYVSLESCSGLTSDLDQLKWAITYNRNDINMVDGDNIQIKVGLDDFLDEWPKNAYQKVELRLVTGSASSLIQTSENTAGDYDCDGKSDFAVFDTAGGYWYVLSSTGSVLTWAQQWGWSTASPVSGDYDGDGKSDFAVFDTANGYWYVLSSDSSVLTWAQQWGWAGALPVSGDYDGDGKSDFAVFDTNGGYWYVLSSDGSVLTWAQAWGWSTATPVSGDYDGDGKSDFAVFDTNSGYWYVLSSTGSVITWAQAWGWSGATPVPGDYDGDGKSDFAVFDTNGGYWYVLSSNGSVLTWAQQWGWSTASPVSGDYDGDGKADFAVFDTANGYWYILSPTGSILTWAQQWGWAGALPVTN